VSVRPRMLVTRNIIHNFYLPFKVLVVMIIISKNSEFVNGYLKNLEAILTIKGKYDILSLRNTRSGVWIRGL
jgi:hypothetical protein